LNDKTNGRQRNIHRLTNYSLKNRSVFESLIEVIDLNRSYLIEIEIFILINYQDVVDDNHILFLKIIFLYLMENDQVIIMLNH